MSLWSRIQSLPPHSIQKVHCLYGDHFPIEVRYVLAQWIEERMAKMENLDPDSGNPTHEGYIAQFVQALIQEVELKAGAMVNDEDPYLIRVKLINAAQAFRHRSSFDPTSLFRYLRQCLAIEQNLVEQNSGGGFSFGGDASSSSSGVGGSLSLSADPLGMGGSSSSSSSTGGGMNSMISPSVEIMEKLSLIKARTLETENILRRMEQEQEAFALKCHDRQKLEGIIHLHRMQQQGGGAAGGGQLPPNTQALEKNFLEQKQRLEYELKQRLSNLLTIKGELEEKIGETIGSLGILQSKILDEELARWKREQQLSGNGAPLMTNNLDTLQSWCEDLAELIWHNRHQLKELERLRGNLPAGAISPTGGGERVPQLQEKITQLLSSLVTSTFIVEKQPPQVMKTNTRFTSTVRLLVGGRLNVHMTPPQVRVAIFSEAQANALLRQDSKTDKLSDTSGEILNNTGTMEYHQGTRHLSVHFRNMQLKRIKRAEKKGTESVMDEKFCLHFQCQFTVGEKELIFKIWTLSFPVVVIVHGNQEPHAWATVTWDNAFGEPGRLPFQVPERVPWFRLAQALNVKFKSLTGRALTEDNIRFLEEKAFRNTPHPTPESALSWSQFCKEPLPDRNFTFWEWFYAIMKLTREHLRGPWVDGSILGFVGRTMAEEMLAVRQPGTFLLRFSDSELGGVTIAWVHQDKKVFSLAPFTSKDLSTRSLADRVNDIAHLHFLYPDIPKGTAFGKYYTPASGEGSLPPQSGKGYVKPQLKTHIPGLSDLSSPSQTPNAMQQGDGMSGSDGSQSKGGLADEELGLLGMHSPYSQSGSSPISTSGFYGGGGRGGGGGGTAVGPFSMDGNMFLGSVDSSSCSSSTSGLMNNNNDNSNFMESLESLEAYAGINLDDLDLSSMDNMMMGDAGGSGGPLPWFKQERE